ncbi:hypothetical protein [Glycomyces xiaoerkulensis]|uniref:hypothetical protein n=1 Tax=Glycomyces xiaoerkulensis TaxID=2038139 RepID=UPI0012FFDB28|nr:hypothetical protein [Glycomyces xiaoerkulensis]
MTRIRAKSGSELRDVFEHFLDSTLPEGWDLELIPADRSGSDQGFDYVITGPDGNQALITVEAKVQVSPANVPRMAAKLRDVQAALRGGPHASTKAVIVSNFISKRSQELLEAAGIGWFDPTGNTKVETDRPSLFIRQSGADQDPNPDTEDRRKKSLRGPGAARVVRALLDGASDTRVHALAANANVGAATSARVLGYLAQEHLVERDEHATVRRVHKRSLVRAWARDYGITRTNHTTTVLAPRGLDWVVEQLAERRLPHVLTGSAALRRYLPEGIPAVTPLSLLAIYSEQTPALQRELRLRNTERGANVLLIEPFDQAVLQRTRDIDGHRYSAPSQTVVDLLTSPGRGPEEAEQLIEVLAQNDKEWSL